MEPFTDTKSTSVQTSNPNMRFFNVILLAVTASLIFFILPGTAIAQTVHIPDPNLRTALELALDKAAGEDITQADMASLEVLQASECRYLRQSRIGGMGNNKTVDMQSYR